MKNDFKDGRVRLPAFVKPELRQRLKVLAAQGQNTLQEFLETLLESATSREETRTKPAPARARS